MIGYIYLTTNLVNGKKYIGQHRDSHYDPSYIGSGSIFKQALKKYKRKNFHLEILCECFSEEELDEKEIYYIAKYNAVEDPMFYNISKGGYKMGTRDLVSMYNPLTDEVIYCAEELIEINTQNGFHLGSRPRNEDSKERYRKSKENLVILTNNEKVIYVHPEDIDEYLIQGYRKGRIPTRPNQKQEHRKWMNKDNVSIMVKETEIQDYLNNGYSFGRIKFDHFNRTAPAHNKNKICIQKDNVHKYINKEELSKYELEGWIYKK